MAKRDLTRSECESWAKAHGVNPQTKRKIKPGGPTYQAIRRLCHDAFGIAPIEVVEAPQRKRPRRQTTPKVTYESEKNTPMATPYRADSTASMLFENAHEDFNTHAHAKPATQLEMDCFRFKKQPHLNPANGKPMSATDDAYLQWKHKCASVDAKNPERIVIPAVIDIDAQKSTQVQPCPLRQCPVVFNDKTVQATPSRKKCSTAYDAFVISAYKHLNICEAPWNYKTHFIPNLTTGVSTVNALHLIHGNVIFPHELYCTDYRDFKKNKHAPFDVYVETRTRNACSLVKQETPDNPFHTCSDLESIISAFETSKLNLLLVDVGVHKKVKQKDTRTSGHAILMIIQRDRTPFLLRHRGWKPIRISIVDPHYPDYSAHYEMLADYLVKFTDKHLSCKYEPFHPEKVGYRHNLLFQSLEGQFPQSSLDRGGYCAVWVVLMMDMIARKFKAHKTQDTTKLVVQPMIVPRVNPVFELVYGLFTSKSYKGERWGPVWRKLIIDYMFSRILDVYAIAHAMGRRDLCDKIYELDLKEYIDQGYIYVGNILDNIMKSNTVNAADFLNRLQNQKDANDLGN